MELRIEDCVNPHCPNSGKPVKADSLTRFEGHVVGFCNPGCRDDFDAGRGDVEHAANFFRVAIAAANAAS